ncbi:MAG TPA: radical SAM protein, partial [Methanocorpusculum sp.]|nr:radical SAM protein [Methanocorpusculum sp.]
MHFIWAKSLLSSKNGMNIFRGCTHGCIYCDSRSLCYQMPHDFSDVAVKENAAELLDDALSRKRRKCMIGFGSMSDPYIPAEKELGLTRRCLEIISRRGFGVSLITKSDLVLRDLDLLKEINQKAKAVVSMTLTTADDVLCKKIEPNVCPTSRRAEVLYELRDAG